jgi:hypothetical protein
MSYRWFLTGLLVLLPLPAAAKKAACTYETLEAFQPGKGVLVSVKRATLQGTLNPDGYMVYPCEAAEQDWQCLKRVSETLLASGTDVKAELAGKVLSYVAVFVIDGQHYEGEFATKADIMKNLEYHQKQNPTAVLESVTEKMDPKDRHVAVQMDDHNAIADDATPKVWMVWNPKDPDLFASLGVLEDAARMKQLALAPGKWRSDGNYEFELSCP